MTAPFRDITPAAIGAGLLVAIVGYGSSVAIVIHGLAAAGASEAEIASALLGLGILMGVVGIGLSLVTRMPISIAWSTPGMALLAGMPAPEAGFPAAVGAFIAAGAMIALAGLWRPLEALVRSIPKPIANAMLAGILLKLCLAPFAAFTEAPIAAFAIVLVWLLVGRLARLWAAPAALVVALALMAWGAGDAATPASWGVGLVLVAPVFDWQAIASIGLPLFIVTMASQNIPGLAVLSTYGYHPPTAPLFVSTGLASSLGAMAGAPTLNLAAITAALCAGPDSGPDPARRYVAAIVAAVGYAALGGLAVLATTLVTRASPVLIEAVAGLALIGAFTGAMLKAVEEDSQRLPAMVTFLVTASGFSLFGIGAAFWGLVAGIAIVWLYR